MCIIDPRQCLKMKERSWDRVREKIVIGILKSWEEGRCYVMKLEKMLCYVPTLRGVDPSG